MQPRTILLSGLLLAACPMAEGVEPPRDADFDTLHKLILSSADDSQWMNVT